MRVTWGRHRRGSAPMLIKHPNGQTSKIITTGPSRTAPISYIAHYAPMNPAPGPKVDPWNLSPATEDLGLDEPSKPDIITCHEWPTSGDIREIAKIKNTSEGQISDVTQP